MSNIYLSFDTFKEGDRVRTTKYYKEKNGFHWTGKIVRTQRSFPGGMIDVRLNKRYRHLVRRHGSFSPHYDEKKGYIRLSSWGKNWPSLIKIRGGKTCRH